MDRNKFGGWHKSSYSSGGNPECIEQGIDASTGTIGIGDTKQKGKGPVVAVSAAGWDAFLASVKSPTGFGGGVL